MFTDKQLQTRFLPSCRSPQKVDMDELMAAMVLSSLSCSPPPPQCPAPSDAAGTQQINDNKRKLNQQETTTSHQELIVFTAFDFGNNFA